MLAGEAIFGLPFHISRYFRSVFVEVFGISQIELGVLGSIYGAVAMFSYLLGGGLADRFSVRWLLVSALIMTGASGFFLITIPAYPAMCVLYGFWGMSTILPFWAALIRATREWGGRNTQGTAFGLLDGGRGLTAALMASVAVILFAQAMPVIADNATASEKMAGLQNVIYLYIGICALAALSVWFFIPDTSPVDEALEGNASDRIQTKHLLPVLRMPAIWLQSIVIIAAYCTYKGTDFYSQYATDVWGWNDVDSAQFSALTGWMRPLAAVTAGLIADRFRTSRVVVVCFVISAITFTLFMFLPAQSRFIVWLWSNALLGCFGIFALRGIYFALLEESKIPRSMTGTAVGVVSFVGFTPEIFFPLLSGGVMEYWQRSATGYHVLFGFLLVMCGVGSAAAWKLSRR